jgi:hypothetical protein
MNRKRFDDAFIDAGHQYQENGEDGPEWRHDYYLFVRIGNAVYVHRKAYRWRQDAEEMLNKVRKLGTVNLTRWEKVQQDERTLEERWNDYGIQEQEMSMGLRADGDYQ